VDVVVINYAGLHMIRNDGGGAFTSATVNFAPFLVSRSVAVGDFDGDGHKDLVVGDLGGAFLIGGNGDGTFRPEVSPSVSPDPSGSSRRTSTATGNPTSPC
jgi:hypothetical protein